MGFLEDLVKTIQEAADEARAQQRSTKSSPEWSPLPEADAGERQRARIVRRQRETQPAPASEPSALAPAPAHRPIAREPHHHASEGAERLRRLLRQPRTVRELVLLRELLDRPLALRPRRGWPR